MKSLMIVGYKQPVENSWFRIGAVDNLRNTHKYPVGWSMYRMFDREFDRSKTLVTLNTFSGYRRFYLERTHFVVRVPFVGSLYNFLIKAVDMVKSVW